MKTFSQEYLKEFPYIMFTPAGADDAVGFDVEFENLNPNEKKDLIKKILLGKKLKDKHGNEVHLKTKDDRENFVKSMKTNTIPFEVDYKKDHDIDMEEVEDLKDNINTHDEFADDTEYDENEDK